MPDTPEHYVLICTTCDGAQPAKTLRAMLEDRLPEGFAIRAVDCMAGCEHPRTVGLQATGKTQYLFGGIQTSPEVDAIVEFAFQYQRSKDGWTNATERPRALFSKTLSRMPGIGREVPE